MFLPASKNIFCSSAECHFLKWPHQRHQLKDIANCLTFGTPEEKGRRSRPQVFLVYAHPENIHLYARSPSRRHSYICTHTQFFKYTYTTLSVWAFSTNLTGRFPNWQNLHRHRAVERHIAYRLNPASIRSCMFLWYVGLVWFFSSNWLQGTLTSN